MAGQQGQAMQCVGKRAPRPCAVPADRRWRGLPICHVHDPAGKYAAAQPPHYLIALLRRLDNLKTGRAVGGKSLPVKSDAASARLPGRAGGGWAWRNHGTTAGTGQRIVRKAGQQ